MRARVQAALDSGGVADAFALCQARVAAAPDDAEAHRHLAALHIAMGQSRAAVAAADRACDLAAAEPRAWAVRGRALAQAGDLVAAIACFRRAVALDDTFTDGWHDLGTGLKQAGEAEAALAAFKRALALDPGRAATWLNLGNLLHETGQADDAVACFARAAALAPDLAQARRRLGQYASVAGKVDAAAALFHQAVSLAPDDPLGLFGLGRTLEDQGDRAGALRCYGRVLERHPGHAAALGHYLALTPEPAPPGLVERAEAALAGPAAADAARAAIGYGLAKHHDRAGRIAQATGAARQANAARRRGAGPLDRAALAARIDGLIATCDADFFARRRAFGLGTDQPVFIVGLPRSGTTLTEQILAAHPDLHGAGERGTLTDLAAALTAAEPDAEPWQAAARLDLGRSRVLARRVLRRLRDGAPRRRLRISDKAPFNLFQLGLAGLLFPNARIVVCRRALRDVALSIWLENFTPDQHYATDFADLAWFAGEVERLLDHWRAVLPLRQHDMVYEDTVADLEAAARRLLGFLGVAWHPACLDFHKVARPVQTPSRWQVRRPLYASSVGRWRAYAPHLPELCAAIPE